MFITSVHDTKSFIATDGTEISELLHPHLFKGSYKLPYSLAHAILKEHQKSTPHRLKTSTEIYIILQGKGIVTQDNEEKKVHKDDIIVIPPGTIQSIKNIGDRPLSFLCLVSPPWDKNDEELIKS